MTSTSVRHDRPRVSVVDQIAECAADLRHLVGDGCIIESPEGRLVSHHVGSVDGELVNALLAGDLTGLHRSFSSRRVLGTLPAGEVLEGRILGRRALHVTVRDAGSVVGGIWLLPSENRIVGVAMLTDQLSRLADLLGCAGPTTTPLAAMLDGGSLPPELAHADRLWVCRVLADVAPECLLRSVDRRPHPLTVLPLRDRNTVYVVIGASPQVGAHRVQSALAALHDETATRVGGPVTLSVSAPCGPTELAIARQQADLGAEVAGPGTIAHLAELRSVLVKRHLFRALASLPDLGPDPLAALLDYDRERGGDLARTLGAWLEASGDADRASCSLGVHRNTLRYRIRRIEEITGLDLRHDATARLELQLRLPC